MDAASGDVARPADHPRASRREALEVLARESRISAIGHCSFHASLIGRRPDASGIHHEAARLRVLQERRVEAWGDRIGRDHDGRKIVGDRHAKDAAVKEPRLLEALDDRGGGLLEGEPAEGVPAEDRGEDQAVGHAAALALRIGHQAHASEVHLDLRAGLAVGQAHRRARAAEAELGHREAVQRAVRHDHAATGEQLVDLGQVQPLGEALLEERALALQAAPAVAVPGGPAGTSLADHRAENLVAELSLVPGLVHSGVDGRVDVTADRLAVHA